MRIPILRIVDSLDLVFNRGIDHRCAKIVFRFDFGGDFFAQHHWFAGGVHGDFKLGLLILFHAERDIPAVALPIVIDEGVDVIHAQCRVGRQTQFTFGAAVLVRLQRQFLEFFAFRIIDLHRKRAVRES